jgi:hypothetical protein
LRRDRGLGGGAELEEATGLRSARRGEQEVVAAAIIAVAMGG